MVCETRAVGCRLKSHGLCGSTRGILHERKMFFFFFCCFYTKEDNFVGAL